MFHAVIKLCEGDLKGLTPDWCCVWTGERQQRLRADRWHL